MPDPYDPAYPGTILSALHESSLSDAPNDPYVMGYYVDNELPWGGYTQSAANSAILSFTVINSIDATAPSAYAKNALLAQLGTDYGGVIAGFNTDFGTTFTSFDDLKPANVLPAATGLGAKALAELDHLSSVFADQYFMTVAATVHGFDSNHLYLGAKFSTYTPEAVAACAKYCDVISFDDYRAVVSGYDALLDTAFATAGVAPKPAIIAEWGYGSTDRGLFWGGVQPTDTQADRAKGYAAYLASVVNDKYLVGAQWFQYWDQPALGEYASGQNGNFGFVSVADRPYPELVSAAITANATVYSTRLALP